MQAIKMNVCTENLRKISGKEFYFIKVTCLQSGTLLEIKLLNNYFPIASSASTSVNIVGKYIWIKDYKKWTWLVNACELCCSNVLVEN